MQSLNALLIENQLRQALSENRQLTKRALLWAGTLTGNSECESSKLETKFKDLSYEIGLRKSAQQQLQRKMGTTPASERECSSIDV